ncbi:MAG: hypothetical protein AB2L20_03420 [Mangrovibacterium sp.]
MKVRPLLNFAVTGVMLLILSGAFVQVLIVGHDLHDATRMGKILFFSQWMLLVIPVGIIPFIMNWKQPLGKLSLFVLAWLGWILLRGKVGGICLGLMSKILVWVFFRYKPLLYLKRVLNTRLKKRLAFILAPLILL